MLKIQEYLLNNRSLSDLYQQYDIQYNICEPLGVVVFNYRMLSPLEVPLVRECRGLVLENNTWNVVGKSIDAFFEPDSNLCKETLNNFDWNSAKAMEKYDGALILMYYYKNEWRTATRFSADGTIPVWSLNMANDDKNLTWHNLTVKAIEHQGISWKEFTSNLDKNIFYTFELIAPENRVFVIYEKPSLILVAAIDKTSLQEIDIYEMNYPYKKANYTEVTSLDEVYELMKEKDVFYEFEGYVVIDKNFNRLKMKNKSFNEMLQNTKLTNGKDILKEISNWELFSTSTSSALSVGGLTVNNPVKNMWQRVNNLSNYIANTYQYVKNLPKEECENHPIHAIWPKAIDSMRQGTSFSDILNNSTEEELLVALEKFESLNH